MDALKQAWRGEERLKKVFLIYGVAGNIAVSLLAYETDKHLWTMIGKIVYVLAFAYFVFSAVALWRCAFNTERPTAGRVVRILVLCVAVLQIFFLFFNVFIKQHHTVRTHVPVHKSRISEQLAPLSDTDTHVPASVMPATITPPTPQEKYKASCEQNLADNAIKNGVDPKQYVAQNQAYVNQCVQYYLSRDKTAR